MSGAETYKLVAMFMGGARLDMHDQGWWVMHDHLECKFHVTLTLTTRTMQGVS